MHSFKRPAHGQTALIVVLFIIIFALTGTTWHLYTLQGQAEETARENLKQQQRNLNEVKDSLQELTQKISSLKDDLSTQSDKSYRLEKESASVKKSIDDIKGEIQNQIKNEVLSIKGDNKQNQEKSQASLSKVEARLEGFTNEIRQLKEELQKTNTPVIDVKLESVTPKKK